MGLGRGVGRSGHTAAFLVLGLFLALGALPNLPAQASTAPSSPNSSGTPHICLVILTGFIVVPKGEGAGDLILKVKNQCRFPIVAFRFDWIKPSKIGGWTVPPGHCFPLLGKTKCISREHPILKGESDGNADGFKAGAVVGVTYALKLTSRFANGGTNIQEITLTAEV